MHGLRPALAALVLVLLFAVVNRGAYRGYFSGDDLDNISWTRGIGTGYLAEGLWSPRYYPQHFRPVGHLTFHFLARRFGLAFPPYVALIQALHLATVCLLYLVLRRLGLGRLHAGAGAAFFLFHMTLFDAVWKPMYLFDVWCGLLCLAALLAYLHERLLLSIVCFWFAYKSKEHAVALPAVLLAYEYLLGTRRWKRVIPFAAIAVMFTVQAVLRNREAGEDYALRLGPAALLTTISYYGARLMTYAAALPVLAVLVGWTRDRRAVWGLAMAVFLAAPMLLLPSRLSGAYLYAALAGVAVAVAASLSRLPVWATAAFFLFWLPLNFERMRQERRAELTLADENRNYVAALGRMTAAHPGFRRFLYDGYPQGLRPWGIRGALKILYDTPEDVTVESIEGKNPSREFAAGGVALLAWDAAARSVRVAAREPGQPDAAAIVIGPETPIWQLEEGWYQAEGKFRWIRPRATARLWRPEGAREFQVTVNAGPGYIAKVRRATLRVLLDGVEIGRAVYDAPGWHTDRFALHGAAAAAAAPAGPANVEFLVEPEFRPPGDPRVLGLPIGSFGFTTEAAR